MLRKTVVQPKLTEEDSEKMWKMWHMMCVKEPLPDMEGYSLRDAAYLGFCRGVMLMQQTLKKEKS